VELLKWTERPASGHRYATLPIRRALKVRIRYMVKKVLERSLYSFFPAKCIQRTSSQCAHHEVAVGLRVQTTRRLYGFIGRNQGMLMRRSIGDCSRVAVGERVQPRGWSYGMQLKHGHVTEHQRLFTGSSQSVGAYVGCLTSSYL
jgi:hypothetical protein